ERWLELAHGERIELHLHDLLLGSTGTARTAVACHLDARTRGRHTRSSEEALRRPPLDDGLRRGIRRLLVLISGLPDAVLELEASTLLHDMRGFVRRES